VQTLGRKPGPNALSSVYRPRGGCGLSVAYEPPSCQVPERAFRGTLAAPASVAFVPPIAEPEARSTGAVHAQCDTCVANRPPLARTISDTPRKENPP
jgi:hypothetical protein